MMEAVKMLMSAGQSVFFVTLSNETICVWALPFSHHCRRTRLIQGLLRGKSLCNFKQRSVICRHGHVV
ncbi:hypothetical protein AB3S75_007016 [Citrus x aurantiifolia]